MGLRREPAGKSTSENRSCASGWRASILATPILLLAGLQLASLAAPDAAAAASAPYILARDTTRVSQPAAEEKPFLLSPAFWEPVRQQAHRLLEPDTRFLRYTLRYAISPELAQQIHEVATAEGIDPELAFRVIRVESRFHPRARSPVGALGLMQLMPSTARWLDPSLRTEAQILDTRTNLRLGMRYLRTLIEQYDDVRLALLAYNRGPGAVDRALRRGADPENGYSRKVLGGTTRYRGPGLLPAEPAG